MPEATTRTHEDYTPAALPKLQIPFRFNEVCSLTGMSRSTLFRWIHVGWIQPIVRSKGGRGYEHQFSAWQVVGLTILSAAVRSAIQSKTQVGRVGVIRAMERLADMDDSLLLAEDQHDKRLTEGAQAIADSALPSEDVELSKVTYERLANVLQSIDRKVSVTRRAVRQRIPDEAR